MNARRRRLDHIIELAHELDSVLTGKLDRILDRSLAHDLSMELRREIERSKEPRLNNLHELACHLESTLELNLMATLSFSRASRISMLITLELHMIERVPARQLSGSCRRLVALAVAFLPACHQARYEEEFRAELADLAPRKQVPHAMRLVTRSLVLRRALIDAPAMRSARR